MQQVSLDEAKERLSDLIDATLQGETVAITTDDGRAVQLVPMRYGKGRPRAGSAKGLIWMSDDFDAPLEDFRE